MTDKTDKARPWFQFAISSFLTLFALLSFDMWYRDMQFRSNPEYKAWLEWKESDFNKPETPEDALRRDAIEKFNEAIVRVEAKIAALESKPESINKSTRLETLHAELRFLERRVRNVLSDAYKMSNAFRTRTSKRADLP